MQSPLGAASPSFPAGCVCRESVKNMSDGAGASEIVGVGAEATVNRGGSVQKIQHCNVEVSCLPTEVSGVSCREHQRKL